MCTFCSTATFFQRNFRLKSASRLVQELDLLNTQYGISHFKLDHDMFTVNRRKVLEFCEAVKDRGYRWRASARVDCVDPDLLVKMAESGCVGLYFGIETGSVRMQEICQKRLDLDLVLPILETAAALGIETTASFITGYPEELEQDQTDTLDLLGHCFRPACLPQLHMLAPEPGTPMFERLGDKILYDGYGGRYNARLVGGGDEQLILDHPDIFQTYYYYPAEMPRSRYIFVVETFDMLRRAGPIILNYVLAAYDGRLSKLVDEVRRFAESHNLGTRPDLNMIEAYMSSKFGPLHHVTSLFRFALRSHLVHEAAPGILHPPAFRQDVPYEINPNAHILEHLHDCSHLLRLIASRSQGTPLLSDAEAGETGIFVIKPSSEGPACYRINPGIAAILELFNEPVLCSVVARHLSTVTGLAAPPLRFFEQLVHAEILVSEEVVPSKSLALMQSF